MNIKKILIVIFMTLLSSAAFAMDRVTLNSGEVLQGTVLSDVLLQYVDIQLINGEKRRIPHDQVASVDRDMPSNKDPERLANDSKGYIGALGGISLNTTSITRNAAPSFGVRGGIDMAHFDFARLAIGVEYLYTYDNSNYLGVNNDIMLQLLFRRVSESGFYFGAEGGVSIDSTGTGASSYTTVAASGLFAGYDFYLSSSFSLGLQLKEDIQFYTSSQSTFFSKGLLTGTFEF